MAMHVIALHLTDSRGRDNRRKVGVALIHHFHGAGFGGDGGPGCVVNPYRDFVRGRRVDRVLVLRGGFPLRDLARLVRAGVRVEDFQMIRHPIDLSERGRSAGNRCAVGAANKVNGRAVDDRHFPASQRCRVAAVQGGAGAADGRPVAGHKGMIRGKYQAIQPAAVVRAAGDRQRGRVGNLRNQQRETAAPAHITGHAPRVFQVKAALGAADRPASVAVHRRQRDGVTVAGSMRDAWVRHRQRAGGGVEGLRAVRAKKVTQWINSLYSGGCYGPADRGIHLKRAGTGAYGCPDANAERRKRFIDADNKRRCFGECFCIINLDIPACINRYGGTVYRRMVGVIYKLPTPKRGGLPYYTGNNSKASRAGIALRPSFTNKTGQPRSLIPYKSIYHSDIIR